MVNKKANHAAVAVAAEGKLPAVPANLKIKTAMKSMVKINRLKALKTANLTIQLKHKLMLKPVTVKREAKKPEHVVLDAEANVVVAAAVIEQTEMLKRNHLKSKTKAVRVLMNLPQKQKLKIHQMKAKQLKQAQIKEEDLAAHQEEAHGAALTDLKTMMAQKLLKEQRQKLQMKPKQPNNHQKKAKLTQ